MESDPFIELMDDLVLLAGDDPEISEGLQWIDLQARKQGVTFYEMAAMIVRRHMAERRAKRWLEDKQ